MSAPRPRARPRPPVAPASNVVELRPGFTLPEHVAPAEKAQKSRRPNDLLTNETRPRDLLTNATKPKGKKRSRASDLLSVTGPIQVRDAPVVSRSGANPAIGPDDPAFRRLIARTPATALREMFPLEANSHRNMLGRSRSGRYVVDTRWSARDGFRAFLEDMGPAPAAGHTLDRRNPRDPRYGPGLCRWANAREQANNRANTVMLPAMGQTRSAADWGRLTGHSAATLRKRRDRGWTPEEVVSGERVGGRRRPREDDAPAVEIVRPGTPIASPYAVDAWPEGVTPAYWEPPYQTFLVKVRGRLNASIPRAAFFAWIGQNKLRKANAKLKDDFPTYNDPEGDPRDAPNVSGHPSAKIIAAYVQPVGEAMAALYSTDNGMDLLRYLCELWPNVFAPEQAPSVKLPEVEDDDGW